VIPATRMLELLRSGDAQPLLPGHFPVPVWWSQRWWYVPDHPSTGPAGEVMFHPAPMVIGARFTQLAARVAVAARSQ
jgi:hypothetical protein